MWLGQLNCLDKTIDVDWDVKPQSKQTNTFDIGSYRENIKNFLSEITRPRVFIYGM